MKPEEFRPIHPQYITSSEMTSPDMKPIAMIPHRSKSTLAGKHVHRLKQKREGIGQVSSKALAAYQNSKESKQTDSQTLFFKHVKHVQPPSREKKIFIKSKTRTFNHTHDFAIENGVIWTRVHNTERPWRAIYFDGYPKGKVPKELHADGTNLIVLDQGRKVHYKKVLAELRSGEIALDKKAAKSLKKAAKKVAKKVENVLLDLEKDKYIAIDKSTANNWKSKWFSLPYIHPIVNLFTGKRLQIPSNARAWAISQRGRYNDYLEDAIQQKHPVGTGVTTLYILSENGRDILKYDPWSPKHVQFTMHLPEDADRAFDALNMSASASTLMVVGYQIEKEDQGQGIKKTLQIQTRLADQYAA